MDVLLSIKPKYVNKIIKGEKKYEFRKTRLDKKRIRYAYIYSTSPVKKIIARVVIDDILEGSPKVLWKKCKKYSGISEEEFFNYYADRQVAFAIAIKDVELLKTPIDPYKEIKNFIAPQSYYYLKDDTFL
ncbi:ASCH domain-containing protein [Methanocella conradii]|uniref:ASCH domain-containing protein n=1 Tax=Methanocella conradii TaxID=1175444 RepID=UPI0024B3BAFA|nr:ASCH domain-containing protein [Methanocella conradii]MDI6897157.1 ASCH domain-containing protein [Methanocella conradii]